MRGLYFGCVPVIGYPYGYAHRTCPAFQPASSRRPFTFFAPLERISRASVAPLSRLLRGEREAIVMGSGGRTHSGRYWPCCFLEARAQYTRSACHSDRREESVVRAERLPPSSATAYQEDKARERPVTDSPTTCSTDSSLRSE